MTNTGPVTINITPSGGAALGAKAILWKNAAVVAGTLIIAVPVLIVYDGASFQIVANGDRGQTLATEQATTSGTDIDFTGIPAGTKRITVMLVGVSTNTSGTILIQIGDAGGPEASGYISTMTYSSTTVMNTTGSTQGFQVAYTGIGGAASVVSGSITLTLEDSSDFTWTESGNLTATTVSLCASAGSKSLSAELTQVRLTTVAGDTFDAGSISISYE